LQFLALLRHAMVNFSIPPPPKYGCDNRDLKGMVMGIMTPGS
jgi:hypothetical protein